jgi:hypothetical protein
MAMLLNASIAEEVEFDVRKLEGKSTVHEVDSISGEESSKAAVAADDEKVVSKSTALDV